MCENEISIKYVCESMQPHRITISIIISRKQKLSYTNNAWRCHMQRDANGPKSCHQQRRKLRVFGDAQTVIYAINV